MCLFVKARLFNILLNYNNLNIFNTGTAVLTVSAVSVSVRMIDDLRAFSIRSKKLDLQIESIRDRFDAEIPEDPDLDQGLLQSKSILSKSKLVALPKKAQGGVTEPNLDSLFQDCPTTAGQSWKRESKQDLPSQDLQSKSSGSKPTITSGSTQQSIRSEASSLLDPELMATGDRELRRALLSAEGRWDGREGSSCRGDVCEDSNCRDCRIIAVSINGVAKRSSRGQVGL